MRKLVAVVTVGASDIGEGICRRLHRVDRAVPGVE